MKYIGVDIGTTFVKGAMLDADRLMLSEVQRIPSPDPLPDDSGVRHEVDPAAFAGIVRAIIDGLVSSCSGCAGILLSGQMGGLVLASERGEALTPYISWLDRRTATPDRPNGESSFDRFSVRLGEIWKERLGREVRPGLPLPFLFHLKERGELPAEPATPSTLPDFVAANLCGVRPVMEWTSTTGSLDLETRSWPTELIDNLGLNHLRWPEMVDFRRTVGAYRTADGRSIPVMAAVGDHQCSLAGTFLEPGELSINISTGSQVAMLADEFVPGECQHRPFFDGRLLRTITNLPAGRALNALVKLLSELPASQGIELSNPWPWILEQADACSESDVEIDLAFFPSPVRGPGRIGNLREDNLTVGHLFRAAFRQMAEYYDRFAGQVDPSRSWKRIAFLGGLAQSSELLRRLICERLGKDFRLATSTEDTLLGLLVLSRVVGGMHATVADGISHVRKQIAS